MPALIFTLHPNQPLSPLRCPMWLQIYVFISAHTFSPKTAGPPASNAGHQKLTRLWVPIKAIPHTKKYRIWKIYRIQWQYKNETIYKKYQKLIFSDAEQCSAVLKIPGNKYLPCLCQQSSDKIFKRLNLLSKRSLSLQARVIIGKTRLHMEQCPSHIVFKHHHRHYYNDLCAYISVVQQAPVCWQA